MRKLLFIVLVSVIATAFIPPKGKKELRFDFRKFEKSLRVIPAGVLEVGPSGSMHSFYLERDTPHIKVDVAPFGISNHEVTNSEYLQFLSYLKKRDVSEYEKMLPDTLVWRNRLGYNEPFVELYLRHDAYAQNPVVGVSYQQAVAYCKWLTEINSKQEKAKYPNAVFRLPTKFEWQYAAAGGMSLSPFSWGGPYMQNKKGEWLANFRVINQGDIGIKYEQRINQRGDEYRSRVYVAEQSRSNFGSVITGFITKPVDSYAVNNYGLYNMCGNVEEFVQEEGITKGGSWFDTGFYLQIWVEENYEKGNSASDQRGFRVAMDMN